MKNQKQQKKYSTKNYLLLVVFLVAVFGLIAIYSWWQDGKIDWQLIGIALAIILFLIMLYIFPKFKQQLMSTIGEKRSIQRSSYRLILPIPFVAPFVFYLLLSGVQKSVPTALQWSIIAIAPTLGGLLLAGASNRRLKNVVHRELISVVQKLIVATVLFIAFTCLFFTVELTGGIDTNTLDLSLIGWIRGGFFWISTAFFYGGVYLFLVAIIDLILALRHIKA